jgi:hypothetical protein
MRDVGYRKLSAPHIPHPISYIRGAPYGPVALNNTTGSSSRGVLGSAAQL